MLRNGLPFINDTPGARVTFHDIYSRTSLNRRFEDLGVPTWRTGRTNDASILSFRSGFPRALDVAAAIPRHLPDSPSPASNVLRVRCNIRARI